MAIRPVIPIKHAGALGSFADQRPRWGWPYTANLLLLLYLMWIAPRMTSAIIERETRVVIPLVLGFACLGASLSAFAPRIRIAIAVAAAFTLYHLWGMFAEATPYSDFSYFYDQSINFMTGEGLGAALRTKSPITIMWYGSVLWLVGPSYHTTYIAAALLWAAQIPLLYSALAAFVSDASAKTAAVLYGFSPSVVLFAPLISSESVFNFLIVLCLYVLSRYQRHAALRTAAALGAASALLFLTRMNGAVFMIAFALYLAVWPGEMRHRWVPAASMLATFLLIVFLNAHVTSHYTGHFSLMPSPWGAYNFMVGTNRLSNGTYSPEDAALAGYGALSDEEASRNALRIGIERITADPLGFVAFAFTDKLMAFWGTDVASVEWTTDLSPKLPTLLNAGIIRLARRLTEAFWLFLNLTAVLTLIWSLVSPRRRAQRLPDELTCVVVLPMLLLSVLHVFIEVQPRYHIPYLPLLCTLSALSLTVLGNRLPFVPKSHPNELQRTNPEG